MGLAQIVTLVFVGMDIGIKVAKHGQRRPDYNGWFGIIDALTLLVLLTWGGFWS